VGALFGLILLLVGMAQGPVTGQVNGPGGEWRVVALGDLGIDPGDNVVFTLADGQISGSAGCNRFSARYALDAGFSLGPVALTRMLCQGRPAEVEARMLATLPTLTGWRIAPDGALELLSGEGVALRALAG
jgi:hypothetical protein